jgi:methyl-accepting chemotaxis protein
LHAGIQSASVDAADAVMESVIFIREATTTGDAFNALQEAFHGRSAADRNGDGIVDVPSNESMRTMMEVLQRLYIANNPSAVGSRDELDRAVGSRDELDRAEQYNAVHALYHKDFRKFVSDRGYCDLLLFDLSGNCLYSVAKEVDFATSVMSGPYSSSGLGRGFRNALNEPYKVHTTAFEPYEPIQQHLASFISTAIADEMNRTIGVLAVRVPFASTVQFNRTTGDRIESCVTALHAFFRRCMRASHEEGRLHLSCAATAYSILCSIL